MIRRFLLLSILLSCCMVSLAQSKAVVKTFGKTVCKNVVKKEGQHATMAIAKEVGRELGEQYAKKAVRRETMRALEKKGFKSVAEYAASNASKRFSKITIEVNGSRYSRKKGRELYAQELSSLRKQKVTQRTANTLAKHINIVPSHLPKAEQINKAIEELCKRDKAFNPSLFKCVQNADGSYSVIYTEKWADNVTILVKKDGTIHTKSASCNAAEKVSNGVSPNKVERGHNELLRTPPANSTIVVDGSVKMKTDGRGRISIVETDMNKLKMEKHLNDKERAQKLQSEVGKKGGPNYDGGHLVQHSQGGQDELMVPMHQQINRGKGSLWRKLEDEERKALAAGKSVKTKIRLEWGDDPDVPIRIYKTTIIDGKETTIVCDNMTGATSYL